MGGGRHLRRLPDIPWAGDVSDPAVQRLWTDEGIEMRLPPGTEFNDPQPPLSNHFSNVFVYHAESKAVHNDDCLCYYERPSKKMGLIVGALIKHDTLAFHSSFTGSGLTDPSAFQNWLESLVDEWNFDILCTAHNGTLCGNASSRVRKLLEESRDIFAKLSSRQELIRQGTLVPTEEEKAKGAWSPGGASLSKLKTDTSASELVCYECG